MRPGPSPVHSYSFSAPCRPRGQAPVAWADLLVSALLVAAGPAAAASPAVEQPSPPLEEIIVTASLRDQSATEFPASITVLGQDTLQSAGLQHFADVLGLVPNLNWSGGTSRPRFFQLRGIGELEQYQGAPNPSVGFLIDDIDLSGVGMPATLFDARQVEVLRGPQGTRYGANALAGLVKIKTRDASTVPDLHVEVTGAEHDTWSAGMAGGGPVGDAGSAWRIAGQRFSSNGFLHNAYLDRDDTNGRDESTLRGKLRWELAPGWRADLAALYVDIDNGFDAFTPDNSRTMLSDQPGRDAQRTRGVSAGVAGRLGHYTVRSVSAYAWSDSVYSFDGDWGNDAYWGEFAPYDYFSRYARMRSTLSQDLRIESGPDDAVDWVAGVYVLRLDEDSRQRDEFAGELLRPLLETSYAATSLAAYGEGEWRLPHDLSLTAGMRVETRSAGYSDSDRARFDPRDTMVGGQVSLQGPLGESNQWYATVARGYKAGGFNIGQFVPDDRRQFRPEYLWNAESGMRFSSAAARVQGDIALFCMWREDQQVATSFQLDPGDPLSYVFYTDNAARGRNYGLEASLAWQPVERLSLGATLGLLHTEYVGYQYGERNLDGREQAHAPGYQYSLSAQWGGGQGWMARADLNGVDAFYFDTSHDQRSDPYTLLNVKAGYSHGAWSVEAWARNVMNGNYAVRGFYFGLEPPDYANKLYVQRGDGRLAGITLQWRW
ncbi:MAG: TonB-dependent receptor [Gammaproteobacteria bacterium]|nr:TonB-dependent receptor [Gammaproteobacteria bacterium]MDH5273667.1 TonB-dependent receptor [Gammaproteobacteria bacterium]